MHILTKVIRYLGRYLGTTHLLPTYSPKQVFLKENTHYVAHPSFPCAYFWKHIRYLLTYLGTYLLDLP